MLFLQLFCNLKISSKNKKLTKIQQANEVEREKGIQNIGKNKSERLKGFFLNKFYFQLQFIFNYIRYYVSVRYIT